MAEIDSAPTALERTLGGLVDAGIATEADLSAVLGLESHHIGRPLRQLTRAGVLESDPGGRLVLTPAGRAWLGIETAPDASQPPRLPERAPAPRLRPLESEADRILAGAEGGRARLRVPVPRWTAPGRTVAGLWRAWPGTATRVPHVRLALPRARFTRVRVGLPPVQFTMGGTALSAATGRRIAAAAAATVVLMIAGRFGLSAWPLATESPRAPGTTVHDAAPARETAPPPGLLATPRPVASGPSERWVLVSHTDGLGLVLRPAPASTARVLTLREGARVRVTGDAVQQAGRAWLPVASETGRTGWVASEFVAPAP